MKRFIALSLLLSLILGTSCGSGGESGKETTSSADASSDGTDVTTAPEKDYPKYDIDLGGEDFNILFFDAVKACGWSSDIPCDVDVAEQTGDVLSDAVYTRNRKIEDMYNLKIKAYDSGDDAWACYKVLEKSVMSGSGEYDAAFCKQQGFEQAAGNGYVTQLDGLLDFDKPWWDSKSLEGFSVLGKTLAVSGDVTFMDKLSYIVIYFNKPMADDYNLGDIYQMVIDKQWTFDKMLSMCGLVSADLNEDGKMDKEDRFGFAGQNDAGYEFYQSAGERFCTLDKDGVPYMSNDSERAIQIFTNIYTFMNDKTNFFNRSKANITVADAIEMFRSNRVLFMMRPLQTIMELRAMDADFGIIPTPMMDSTQKEYYTSIGFTVANAVMIPADVKDPAVSAQVLDTLSAESYYNLNSVLYDMVLGTKYTRDDSSSQNLDIIMNNVVYDPGCIYGFGGMAAAFNNVLKPDTITSTIAGFKDKVQADIDKYIETIS